MEEGRIIIEPGANAWVHELKTARAFTARGCDVVFLAEDNEEYRTSPDVIIHGIQWEIKAPRSPKMAKVLKVIRDALHQAPNVIYDSQRIQKISDAQIERELRRISPMLPAMKNLLFVNRKRQIIVIKQTQQIDFTSLWRYHS